MVQLSITDFVGLASLIFSTPAGDLSLMQPIDWLAPGAIGLGQLSTSGDMAAQFRLTSIDVIATSPRRNLGRSRCSPQAWSRWPGSGSQCRAGEPQRVAA
jgi:hypothetical protein